MATEQSLLLRIFANISAGTHPSSPLGPSSVLEHFTRTRYADLILPAALKECGAGIGEPSPACISRVSKRMFEMLAEQERISLMDAYESEWTTKRKRHERALDAMYGQVDLTQCVFYFKQLI